AARLASALSLRDALPISFTEVSGSVAEKWGGNDRPSARKLKKGHNSAGTHPREVRVAQRRTPALGPVHKEAFWLAGWLAGEEIRSEEHTSELQSRENLVC